MNIGLQKTGWPLAFAVIATLATAAVALAHPPIDIVASNWKFIPAKISIPINQPTTLHLTSSSGVHGIESKDLAIEKTTISPGKFVDVTFTPKTAGTYVLHCAVICGPGHPDMTLTIEVTP
jgi:cytochrome c oxidase subunit II